MEKYLYQYHLVELTPAFQAERAQDNPLVLERAKSGSSLCLGQSTGLLASLWHRAGLAPNQLVTLGLTDACQNIVIFGSISSGKTTAVMQPLIITMS